MQKPAWQQFFQRRPLHASALWSLALWIPSHLLRCQQGRPWLLWCQPPRPHHLLGGLQEDEGTFSEADEWTGTVMLSACRNPQGGTARMRVDLTDTLDNTHALFGCMHLVLHAPLSHEINQPMHD